MDIKEIIGKITDTIKDAPEHLQGLISNPAEKIKELTGLDAADIDVTEVVKGVLNNVKDLGIDIGDEAKKLLDSDAVKNVESGIGDFIKGIFGKKDE